MCFYGAPWPQRRSLIDNGYTEVLVTSEHAVDRWLAGHS